MLSKKSNVEQVNSEDQILEDQEGEESYDTNIYGDDGKKWKAGVQWKHVALPLFSKSYQISSEGQVRSVRNIKSGVLKAQQLSHVGYPSTRFDIGGANKKTYDIHVVMAKTFIGPRPPKLIVNHMDGDKENNKLENLEYATQSANAIHAKANGLIKVHRPRERVDLSTIETYDIEGFSKYCIDEQGNIYNKKTSLKIKPFTTEEGYMRIGIKPDDEKLGNKRYLHNLIAEVFISNPDNLPIVNHINEDKKDNRIENLEWCTFSHNMKEHARLNNRSRKVASFNLKGTLVKKYGSIKEASHDVGLASTTIITACSEGWKAGKYFWKYIDLDSPKKVN
ncbi:MAG: putative HNH endonuclease [Hyperionvirus sp.]|uniref:Putative HNH endonuclease n=1 Tax=Hyperionvirus sp. TaxID=2487770 RepID=A0A3G5AE80_9VIRU|nr:MAG: putative HNH endonuclease [Hyperionvirus sp.]